MQDSRQKNGRPTIDERFTTKTIVDLYEVRSRGYRVTCDMWYEERHDLWSREHGIFADRAAAERKREEIAAAFDREGYTRSPSGAFFRGYHDAYVEVSALEAVLEDLAVDDLGQYSYKGKEVIL